MSAGGTAEESAPPAPEPPQLEGLSQRVLRRALIKIRYFRQELDSLRSTYAEREDLPGLRTLIDAMSTIVAEAEREVTVRSRDLYASLETDGDDEEVNERFCDIVGGLINALEYTLPNLLQTVREPHGREIEALTLPFTSLVENLLREEATIELIFEPDDDYSYDLSVLDELRQIAQKFTSSLRDLLGDLPQLIAITYPKQLEAETLGHVIIAHEIAHTIVDHEPPGFDGPPIIEAIEDAITNHYDSVRKAIEGSGVSEKDVDGRTTEAIDRTRRWYEELVCDALALGMVGPVYVFALADFELASNRWAQIRGGPGYGTHPGLTWRLRRAIAQALDEYLPEDSTGPVATTLRRSLSDLEETLPPVEDQISRQERDLIDAALTRVEEEKMVAKVLGQARYLPSFLAGEGELVWQKLQAGIPPAERIKARDPGKRAPLEKVPEDWSEPIGWQSIFNGAYAYWLAGEALSTEHEALRTIPERRGIAKDWIKFNSYIRGSVELANLHIQLGEARERLDGLNHPERS